MTANSKNTITSLYYVYVYSEQYAVQTMGIGNWKLEQQGQMHDIPDINIHVMS
jgi:hypothetical protein